VNLAVLELQDVVKDYRGLRPLRIERLAISAGESIALVGLDQPMAEVLVNLVTGATLPDRGTVQVFGRSTGAVSDSSEWLRLVDRFGIVSPRAVLLPGLTVTQNLAMPFSLDIEPPSPDLQAKADQLAREAGLPESTWTRPVAELDGAGRARARLARALALDPSVLLFEHATAEISGTAVQAFGRSVREITVQRSVAALIVTADREFARCAAAQVLVLDAASGRTSVQKERRRFPWL
jgi:ABC-type transporter Mla maintaining outer membrane lipid asymmetry ATPase subunit MlaF